MKFNTIVPGLILVLIGAYAWWESGSYPPGISGGYGSAFFPRVIASAMILIGLLLAAGGVRQLKTEGLVQFAGWAGTTRAWSGVAVLIGALVFLTATLKVLGFPIAAFISTAAFMTYLRGRPASSLALSAVVVILIHLMFSEIFSVVLPLGVLGPLIR